MSGSEKEWPQCWTTDYEKRSVPWLLPKNWGIGLPKPIIMYCYENSQIGVCHCGTHPRPAFILCPTGTATAEVWLTLASIFVYPTPFVGWHRFQRFEHWQCSLGRAQTVIYKYWNLGHKCFLIEPCFPESKANHQLGLSTGLKTLFYMNNLEFRSERIHQWFQTEKRLGW